MNVGASFVLATLMLRVALANAPLPSVTRTVKALPPTSELVGVPDKAPFEDTIEDFYLSNPIARASATMAECSAIAEGSRVMTAAE